MTHYGPGEIEPVEAPPWLVDLVSKHKRPSVSDGLPSAKTVGIGAPPNNLAVQCALVSGSKTGERNEILNQAAFSAGKLVGASQVPREESERRLYEAAAKCGLVADDGDRSVYATIRSGLNAGIESVRQTRRTNLPLKRPEGVLEARMIDLKAPLEIAQIVRTLHYVIDKTPTLHHSSGRFYRWNGRYYEVVSDDDLKAELYTFLASRVCWTREGEISPVKPNTRLVREVLEALRAECNIQGQIKPPFWLADEYIPDMTFPPEEIVACANGLLHLPSCELQPPTPLFFSLNALEFDYDPDTPDPAQWNGFLQSLWPNDCQAVGTLQEIFGYLLTHRTEQQKIFMLVGPKRSGKSTIARILAALIGETNCCAPTLSSLTDRFGLEPMIGKLVAIVGDARLSGRSDQAIIAERLLSISGEDSITVDRKYATPVTTHFSVRFLILTNELPRLQDASGALASRFQILRLTRSFFGHEDLGLGKRLICELPGILNWAIAGWQRLHRRGHFIQSRSAVEDSQELEELASPIAAFVHENCAIDPGEETAINAIYVRYRGWCDLQGRKPLSKQAFARDLRAVVPDIIVCQHNTDQKAGERFYRGIRLL